MNNDEIYLFNDEQIKINLLIKCFINVFSQSVETHWRRRIVEIS
jgi:hypothetical protein